MKPCPKYLPQITTTDAKKLFGVPEGTTHYWLKQGHVSFASVVHGTTMEVLEFSRLEFQMHLFTEQAGDHRRADVDLPISELVLDPEFEVRVKGLNQKVVKEYAERFKLGSQPPPPVVVAVIDGKKCLLGGRHRVAAAKLAGRDHIKAIVLTECDRAEAFYVARTDNDGHGLKIGDCDRKKNIRAALLRPEYAKMTVPELAREFHYSERHIKRIRKGLLEERTAAGRVIDQRTMEERAFDQLVNSLGVLEKFQPELTMKLRAVIAESRG
jgi:hypothetical protein